MLAHLNEAQAATLVELLARRAGEPRREAFSFAGRGVTFDELWYAAGRVARRLRDLGVGAGDRVVLVLGNGPEFFAAFFGAQRVAAIPVPLFPRSGAGRIADLAAHCGAAAVLLASTAAVETLAAVAARCSGGTAVVRTGQAAALGAEGPDPDKAGAAGADAAVLPEQPALIQYTSGTTGDPKGVILTHANLLINMRQMIAGMEITADDVFVSWLPVHHDMGLILMALVPFLVGARLALLPEDLNHAGAWLEVIHRERGTFTAAPDFAYRLCLAAVRDPSRFDLTSLRVALDAAEPVRAETLHRFEETFGLRRVMVPGYGLAEATVGVSMQPPGTAPKVSERGFVAIGRPFPGVRIEIVADDRPARTGEVGELVVESPANCGGYFRDPRATAELFHHPGAIRTGDLGYRDGDGEVFLVGRAKNIILQAGRNLSPVEIEGTVEALPFVRRVAAVGIDRGGAEGEQAYVFAELRRALPPPPEALQEMAVEVVASIHERLGLRPGRVLLLAPRSIPRTANGKIRHPALRLAYLDGSLRARGRLFFPPQPEGTDA